MNKYLEEIKNQIEVLSFEGTPNFLKVLENHKISANKNNDVHTIVDWTQFEKTYNVGYDYEGAPKEISVWLAGSALILSEFVIIEMGYGLPVIKTEAKTFIADWYRFLMASGFMGISVISDDGCYVLEFSDDGEHLLRSNFPVGVVSQNVT